MDNKIKPHTYQLHTEDIIDLKKIFEGGQIFSWSEYSQGYMGLIDNIPFCVSYKNNTLYFETSIKEMVAKQKVIHFFDLNTSVKDIESTLISTNDSYMYRAIESNQGLRILKQDPWMCMVSFICSSVANFNKISLNVKNISENLGDKLIFNNQTFYTFPNPKTIANQSIDTLREYGLGFRSKYLRNFADKITNEDFNLEKLKNLTYYESRKILESLYGVGSKIADCVLLYSLNKTEAFPIDRWVQRALRDGYGLDINNNYNISSEWARANWKEHSGYAQQFLFQYQKELNNEK
tara:strand:- start:11129 stop:12007 length:879 start_codon:yes stop_codon:yes gene_type:complete